MITSLLLPLRKTRPRTVLTPRRIKSVRETLRRKPQRSGRKVDKGCNVSHMSIHRVLSSPLYWATQGTKETSAPFGAVKARPTENWAHRELGSWRTEPLEKWAPTEQFQFSWQAFAAILFLSLASLTSVASSGDHEPLFFWGGGARIVWARPDLCPPHEFSLGPERPVGPVTRGSNSGDPTSVNPVLQVPHPASISARDWPESSRWYWWWYHETEHFPSSPASPLMLYVDKKLFTFQAIHNIQNNRVWAAKSQATPVEVRTATRVQGMATIKMQGGVISDEDGHKSLLTVLGCQGESEQLR